MRGLTLVPVMWPKFGFGTQTKMGCPGWPASGFTPIEPALRSLGLANCGVLKALKNSVRKSRLNFSFQKGRVVRFKMAKSKLSCAGPRTAPTGRSPKSVPPSTVITFGPVRQLGLNQPSRRLVTEPEDVTCPALQL